MLIRDSDQAARLASKAMRQALDSIVSEMDADLDNLFLDDKWPWDGATLRKSGELAGSPRNIYDLGRLYASEQERVELSDSRAVVTREWEAFNESGQDYAPFVHDGTSTTNARPWTDRLKAEQEQRYAQIFADEFARRFQGL